MNTLLSANEKRKITQHSQFERNQSLKIGKLLVFRSWFPRSSHACPLYHTVPREPQATMLLRCQPNLRTPSRSNRNFDVIRAKLSTKSLIPVDSIVTLTEFAQNHPGPKRKGRDVP